MNLGIKELDEIAAECFDNGFDESLIDIRKWKDGYGKEKWKFTDKIYTDLERKINVLRCRFDWTKDELEKEGKINKNSTLIPILSRLLVREKNELDINIKLLSIIASKILGGEYKGGG